MRQNYRFQLLAPSQLSAQGSFARSKISERVHRQYLHRTQRLRGRIYLQDGAIQPCELRDDVPMRGDERSWHLLLLDQAREVIGCARYLVHFIRQACLSTGSELGGRPWRETNSGVPKCAPP